MVIVWIHLLLLLPCILISAEFTATINRNEVGLGEGFVLNLTLKDASAVSQPSIEPLRQAFTIHSQQQSYSTMMINGTVSSSQTWTYALVPQTPGEAQIPSISIDTSQGKLFTQPLTMRISRERHSSGSQTGEDLRVESEVSNLRPYKNEPFFLTVRLLTKKTLSDLHAEKFEVPGAIVEPSGEPVIGERMENGVRVVTVEFKYLITPMQSDKLEIPAISIHGNIPQKRTGRSLYDDVFGPFTMMQGLVSLQPFALATKQLELEILPPVNGLVPWLPAHTLEMQEDWDDRQTVHEGEVFARSFVISAEGVHSTQLPSLEGMLDKGGQFKVYADKPELKDEIVDGTLKSYRLEQYTLVPQKSGELTMPQISVKWWDTKRGEERETVVPTRTLQVIPAVISSVIATQDFVVKDERKSESGIVVSEMNPIVYLIIGGLAILLAAVLIMLLLMQRKMKRLMEASKKPKAAVAVIRRESLHRKKRDKLEDLNPT